MNRESRIVNFIKISALVLLSIGIIGVIALMSEFNKPEGNLGLAITLILGTILGMGIVIMYGICEIAKHLESIDKQLKERE
jgi:hypothetical protein